MVEGKGEFDGANIGGGEQQELYQVTIKLTFPL